MKSRDRREAVRVRLLVCEVRVADLVVLPSDLVT